MSGFTYIFKADIAFTHINCGETYQNGKTN